VITDPASGFEAFYLAHHATIVRALALTLGDNQLGAEATDEAMTRAYQRWSQVSTYRNPEGWVYRVGLNWARSFLRKRRRTTSSPFVDETPVHDPSPADPALAAALAALDPKHRSVVVLRYLLDWSVDQTAEALEIAPGTVKSRLHRALSQLETRLGPPEEPS
jgi:RNA polymerase sigma-70 factor (ECF subfamily)